jgi:hypothetical protein
MISAMNDHLHVAAALVTVVRMVTVAMLAG